MANIFNVKLGMAGTPPVPVLLITPSNGIITISKSDVVQSIVWNLKLNSGQTGRFNDQDNLVAPGFAWIGSTPNQGIFGKPVLSGRYLTMTLTDIFTGVYDNGTWFYRIAATINGVVYTSVHQGITSSSVLVPTQGKDNRTSIPTGLDPMNTTNPSIKNR